MQQISKRNFSQWLLSRLATASKSKTVALVVDKSEVKDLDFIKPLNESQHFCQDLAMDKHHWVYTNDRRALIV